MTFSPELETKLRDLLNRYPDARRKSALIPMLMFTQDEVGSITPELIQEVASRIGIPPVQVDEVVTYYSMLHKKAMGKYHIQVCTNISCLLWDADQLWEHACKKTGLGHKQVSEDGQISLEEVECMGACSWAPAVQVNYDFHHYVTKEKLDEIIDGLKRKPQ